MSLVEQARRDVLQITTNKAEWGVDIMFTNPDGTQETIAGTATKHHLSIDNEGAPVNAKNASCTFCESALTLPIRNTAGEVSLKGWKATWKDSTGSNITYMVREWFPDETLGLIVCILGDYK